MYSSTSNRMIFDCFLLASRSGMWIAQDIHFESCSHSENGIPNSEKHPSRFYAVHNISTKAQTKHNLTEKYNRNKLCCLLSFNSRQNHVDDCLVLNSKGFLDRYIWSPFLKCDSQQRKTSINVLFHPKFSLFPQNPALHYNPTWLGEYKTKCQIEEFIYTRIPSTNLLEVQIYILQTRFITKEVLWELLLVKPRPSQKAAASKFF